MIPLQKKTTRENTIKTQLSNHCWAQGIESFFTNHIPFSCSTSPQFATQCCALFDAFLEDQKSAFEAYEIGAGLGVLSKRICEVQKKHYPHWDKCTFHITDQSQALIDTIKKEKLFDAFPNTKLHTLDCSNPNLKLVKNPSIFFMTYLLDCIPPKHILIENGKIYELQINTWLKKNSVLLDTSTLPPKLLTPEKIKEYLFTNQITNPIALSKLNKQIQETYIKVPLKKSSLTTSEKKLLNEYCNEIDNPPNTQFNFSESMYLFFKALNQSHTKDKLFLCFDIGDLSSINQFKYKDYKASYGAATFYKINFTFLKFIAKKLELQFQITNFKNDSSHIACLYKTKKDTSFKKIFKKIFKNDHTYEEDTILQELKKTSENKRKYPKKIAFLEKKYIQNKNIPYSHLMELVIQTFYMKDTQKCKQYAKRIVNEYGPLAIKAHEYLGRLYQEEKKYEKALFHLKSATKWAPHLEHSQYNLALIYLKQGDVKSFLLAANNTLKAYRKPFFLSLYHLIITTLISLKQDYNAQLIINKILNIHQENPHIFDQKTIGKIKKEALKLTKIKKTC